LEALSTVGIVGVAMGHFFRNDPGTTPGITSRQLDYTCAEARGRVMAKKMYVVDVELTMVVMAESKREAISIAQDHVEEEAYIDTEAVTVVSELKKPSEVPPYWKNCIPWGSDDDRTIEAILSEGVEGA
jgi:hypothetical protein